MPTMNNTLRTLAVAATAFVAAGAGSILVPGATASAAEHQLSAAVVCPDKVEIYVTNTSSEAQNFSLELKTSIQHWVTPEFTVASGDTFTKVFNVVQGQRVDHVRLRDDNVQYIDQFNINKVITADANCTRDPFDLYSVIGYDVSCVDGHHVVSLTIANDGDYAHEMHPRAAAFLPTEEESWAAQQAGLITYHEEIMPLPAHTTQTVNLTIDAVEQIYVAVGPWPTPPWFVDGPRSLWGDELDCAKDYSLLEPFLESESGSEGTTETTPGDTTPEGSNESAESSQTPSGAAAPTGSLPVTGGSVSIGFIATTLLSLGVLCLRIAARKRSI